MHPFYKSMVTPLILQNIAEAILQRLSSSSFSEAEKLLQMNDYHGFQKSRLPEEFLDEILVPFGLTPLDVQIEIVKVDRDLSKEVHYHKNSFAYCVCLGEKYKTENPQGAKAFLKESWFPMNAGDIIQIPPNTLHGFAVENNGILVFLSVQAPPIEHEGKDDYYKVEV